MTKQGDTIMSGKKTGDEKASRDTPTSHSFPPSPPHDDEKNKLRNRKVFLLISNRVDGNTKAHKYNKKLGDTCRPTFYALKFIRCYHDSEI